MKINSRHYTLLLFALCTVFATALGYFFLYKKISAQASRHAQVSYELSNESMKKQNEQALIAIYKETSAERTKISSFFIRDDMAVDFIERIEKAGVDSQTELELSSIVNDDGFIKAKVDVDGTWSGVMNALMLLENMPFAVKLNDVRLDTSGDLESTDKKSTSAHEWHLSLTVEALTWKPAQ